MVDRAALGAVRLKSQTPTPRNGFEQKDAKAAKGKLLDALKKAVRPREARSTRSFRSDRSCQARAPLAFSTITAKPPGSRMAISDSIFRFNATRAFVRPWIRRL